MRTASARRGESRLALFPERTSEASNAVTCLWVRIPSRPLRLLDRPQGTARRLVLSLHPDSGIRVIGAEARRHWPDVAPGRKVERLIRFVPRTGGRHLVRFSATSRAPIARVEPGQRAAP
jgi:hypothetical protein